MTGEARLNGTAPNVAIITDGPCIDDTTRNLEASGQTSAALERVRAQAAQLLDAVVASYEAGVASGEVGAEGTGRASDAPPLAGDCPTGLLYGRIQSGKTLAMITFTALALDNGFRVVVVLTSDNVKLVEQTADRFTVLDGPLVKNSTQADRWMADAAHVKRNVERSGLVIVCSKNQAQLTKLIDFLITIEAGRFPSLLLDDEADQATPDTTTGARTANKPNAPKQASTINRRTVRNDASDESGRSVREQLRHNVFLQVTATPYALLLQNSDSPLKPQFTILLEPGVGYTGGESFFSDEHIEEQLPPVVFVREEESDELERGAPEAPPGLVLALSFFTVAAGAQLLLNPQVRTKGQNFLCHTSQKTTEHERLSGLMRDFLTKVGDALGQEVLSGPIAIHLENAYTRLRATLPEAPPFADIVRVLKARLPRREIIVVNSTGSNATFGREMNFIVGGNILGRGLTIENLLVTYYLRRAKVSQMDTMLQHARMFGYRAALMPFTRVFLPERLALRFHNIHTAEQNLRDLLSDPERRAKIPVQVADGLRATRLSVLDMGSIEAYTPGQHIYPGQPMVSANAHRAHEKAEAAILRLLGGTWREHKETDLLDIAIDDILGILDDLPFDDKECGNWDPAGIRGTLESARTAMGGRASLYTREMRREKFAQGALGGPVLKALRASGRPVLCVFKDVGRKFQAIGASVPYDGIFWYPTLVLPEDGIPAHVFNTTG